MALTLSELRDGQVGVLVAARERGGDGEVAWESVYDSMDAAGKDANGIVTAVMNAIAKKENR